MVSPLWTAASEGDLATVSSLLADNSSVDIEIKDHDGSTPLLQAVRNGHVQVVKTLLDRGASVSACPEFAQLEQVTSNPEILALLANAGNVNGAPSLPNGLPNGHSDMVKPYYPPPMSGPAYPYFPTLNTPPVDGAAYYSPSGTPYLSGEDSSNGAYGHYPPPEVARMIPCRYFPACRYGSSCMFAHPQAPYFPSSMPPPAQYPPPFDHRSQPYPPNYYGAPPAPYPPANGMSPMSPMSPHSATPHTPSHPGLVHSRSASELSPPPPGPPFSPAGAHPLPYPSVSPMSPPGYAHPPIPVPMGVPSLPPMPPQAMPHSGPQSPSVYPSPGPYPLRPNGVSQYPTTNGYPEANGIAHPSPSHADGVTRGPGYRDGNGHNRRGSFRRNSFVDKKKPPCIFFPSGKCKNGDDCRFVHVMPEAASHHYPHQNGYYSGRGSGRRGGFGHTNGVSHLAEKMGNMTIREPQNPEHHSRAASDNHFRGRFAGPNGVRNNQPVPNGTRHVDRRAPLKTQRVPQADEFPALAGASTPRARSPGSNGSVNGSGPTAAQVLQRPAPQRGDSYREPMQNGTSSPDAPPAQPLKDTKHDVNVKATASPVESTPPVPTKSIPSFASIASPATTGPAKELSVTA